MSNTLKTTLLLGLLTGLLMWIGQLLGGTQGLAVFFVFAVVMNFGSYWFSDRIVLAAYGARELPEQDAPDLFRIVRELAVGAHMPMPRVYLIPSESPNAFATGRSPEHAAVAVTEGILRLLTLDELRGVLAHELSHVRNRDTLTSAIAATLAGAVMMVARMAQWAMLFGGWRRDDREEGSSGLEALVMIIVAPLAAMLIQLAISRAREYQADASGAQLSHAPHSLAAALEKIGAVSGRVPLPAGPATAHLWIVNPLRGNWLAGLFSTHPPIEERIRRLRAMAY
ncbi:MAG: protease HtpX [Deltaproteobacteria bacterium]|nr:MAG: protease HtpX [Deltaproteobacteria bacterium]